MSGEAQAQTDVRFAGYAALFDRVDRGGDVIRRGAFARAIERLGGGKVPLLWQHRPGEQIGVIESVSEDARGLRVIGRVTGAGEAAALLTRGTVRGLSFGYRVREASGARPRELKQLDLIEVSLVTFPMQPKAQVHAVEG